MPPAHALDADRIAAQLGPPYLALDAAERARHPELLARIARREDMAFDARPALGADGGWIATICGPDSPGALSLIAGTLTAHGVDIVDGELFTLRREPPADARAEAAAPSRLLLDRLELRAAEAGPELWRAVAEELAEAFALLAGGRGDAARELVIERVSRALAPREAEAEPLYPVTIELDTTSDPDATALTIAGADERGFLFEFANALALLEVSVQRAAVRTTDGESRDTFWVTSRAGAKLEDAARLEELRVVAVLIRQFTHLLPLAPDPAQALRQFSALARGMLARAERRASLAALADEGVLETLAATLGVSRFLWEDFLRLQHENLFPVLTDRPALDARKTAALLRDEVRAGAPGSGPPDAQALNAFKDRELFRIDLRYVTGRTGFIEFSGELSDLAEVVVGEAAAIAERDLQARHGAPRLLSGAPCRWTIAALGKFGGRELGFASDLELVTVYEGAGTTDGADPIPNAAYFDQLVRGLRDAVHAPREGIFELDLRLRPYGAGGSLADSIDGCRRYYAPGGDALQFERMALVRLRRVAGDVGLGRTLEAIRDSFVYSGAPLDLAELRHLRDRQASELVAPGERNAKHSPGGVVDIEYYVQVRQILAGATHPAVRTTNTLQAIDALARGGHLDYDDAAKLPEAYAFLRRLIDALRVVRGNARDLSIPPAGSREFAYLARRLFYDPPEALANAIEVRMAYAASLWERLPEG
jgi:glutamate-ammonia-ligase adenylyltransferase